MLEVPKIVLREKARRRTATPSGLMGRSSCSCEMMQRPGDRSNGLLARSEELQERRRWKESYRRPHTRRRARAPSSTTCRRIKVAGCRNTSQQAARTSRPSSKSQQASPPAPHLERGLAVENDSRKALQCGWWVSFPTLAAMLLRLLRSCSATTSRTPSTRFTPCSTRFFTSGRCSRVSELVAVLLLPLFFVLREHHDPSLVEQGHPPHPVFKGVLVSGLEFRTVGRRKKGRENKILGKRTASIMRKKVDHADNYNISVDHDQQQHDKISSTKLDNKDHASGPSSSMLATSSTTSTALAARRSSTATSSAVLESRRNSSPTSGKIPPVQLPGEPPPPGSVAPEPPDGKFYPRTSQHDAHPPSQQEVVEHQHDLQPPGSTTEFISTSAHLTHDRQRPARGTTSNIGQEELQQGDVISTMQRFVVPGPSEGEGPPDGTSSSASAVLEVKRTRTTRRSVLRPEIKVEQAGGQALRPPALVPPKRPPERKPHGTTRAIAKQLHQGHEDVDEQAPLLVPGDQPEDASRAAVPFMSEAVDEGVSSVDLVQRPGEGGYVAGILASRRPASVISVVEKQAESRRHKNYRFLGHPQGQDPQKDSVFEMGTSRNGVMLKIPKNNTFTSTNRTAGKIAELHQSLSVVERHNQHLGGRRAASNHEVASWLSVEDGGSIDFQQLFGDTLPRHMTWEHLFSNPAAKTVQGQPTGLLTRYFQAPQGNNELDVSNEAVAAIIQQYGQTLCSTLSFNSMLAASSLHKSPPHGDGGKAYQCNDDGLRSVFYPNGVGREWSKMYGAPDDAIGYDHQGTTLLGRWQLLVTQYGEHVADSWFDGSDQICERDCSLLSTATTAISAAPRVITEAALVNIVLRCVQMDFGRTMWANGKDVANDGTNGAIMYATAAKPDPSYGEDQMFHYPWLEPMGDQGNPEYDYALVYNITQTSCKTLPGWLSHEELAARIQGYLAGVCMTSSVNDCTSAGVRPRVFPRDVAKDAELPGGGKWFTSGAVCETASNNAAAYDTMKQAMRLDLQSPDGGGIMYFTKPAYPGLLAGEDPEATSWRSTCIPSTADDKELAADNLEGLIELHNIYNRLQEYCKLVMLYDGNADDLLYKAQLFVVYGKVEPGESAGENSAPHNAAETAFAYHEHRKNGCRALLYMDRAEPVRHTDGSVRTSKGVTGVMDSWQQPKGYVIPGDNPEGHGLWEGHFLYAGLDYAEEFTELSLGGPGGGDGSSGDATSTGANSTDAGDAGSTTPAPAPSSSTDAAGGEGDAGPTTPTPAAQGETGGDGSTGDSGGSAEGDEGNKTSETEDGSGDEEGSNNGLLFASLGIITVGVLIAVLGVFCTCDDDDKDKKDKKKDKEKDTDASKRSKENKDNRKKKQVTSSSSSSSSDGRNRSKGKDKASSRDRDRREKDRAKEKAERDKQEREKLNQRVKQIQAMTKGGKRSSSSSSEDRRKKKKDKEDTPSKSKASSSMSKKKDKNKSSSSRSAGLLAQHREKDVDPDDKPINNPIPRNRSKYGKHAIVNVFTASGADADVPVTPFTQPRGSMLADAARAEFQANRASMRPSGFAALVASRDINKRSGGGGDKNKESDKVQRGFSREKLAKDQKSSKGKKNRRGDDD
ncbi:unnamed protein product [Amoebophrya sp. A120]|nr:unnamed protein product [Amoebophrya sp. A120]|eukprot:GSA120T00015674001.1